MGPVVVEELIVQIRFAHYKLFTLFNKMVKVPVLLQAIELFPIGSVRPLYLTILFWASPP